MITLEQIKAFLNPFKGATSSSNGRKGIVPAPKVNDRNKFLKGNGSWSDVDFSSINSQISAINNSITDLSNNKANNSQIATINNSITNLNNNKANIDGSNIAVSSFLTKLGFSEYRLSADGYYKFPQGLILQWGYVNSLGNDSSVTVTLPVTYPNTIVFASYMQNNTGLNLDGRGVQTVQIVSNSQITLHNGQDVSAPARWFTVGY